MSNRSGGYSCHTGSNIVQPEIHIIKLHKSTNGMGLSIVAAKVCACIYVLYICIIFVYVCLNIYFDVTKSINICLQ